MNIDKRVLREKCGAKAPRRQGFILSAGMLFLSLRGLSSKKQPVAGCCGAGRINALAMRLSIWTRWLLVAMAGVALCSLHAGAAGIRETKHNLSAGGPGPIKAAAEGELCVFCHTPHQGRLDIPYLWNRSDSTANYTPYQSSTLSAAVGQPTGASKLCLSCHDGTVALGMLSSRPSEVEFVGGLRFMPDGPSRIGTDLSTSHPISFKYDDALAASNQALKPPATLTRPVRLDQNGQLQCSSCHDPHDNSFGKFLVMSNQNAQLCTVCHAPPGWTQSSHSSSTATWNGMGPDPWPDSEYASVAGNGCVNCHKSHGAGSAQRLLRHAAEEDNCLGCHNGNVAASNIGPELTKASRHGVQDYIGVHDPAEDFTLGTVARHVECADCHNPHQSNDQAGPAPGDPPLVSGATAGVSGIDIGGSPINPATYTYEICFKCHSETQMPGSQVITRQIDQLNTRLEFAPANPSFHPVAALGVNADVPSLIHPLTVQSRVDCLDCHNNSASFGPRGPHGSDHPFLLAREYATSDYTIESESSYALCYQCHSRASLLADQSFPHNLHVVGQQTPCSACHDPHGVNNIQGNATNNSHLINFDIDIVLPDSQGRLYFEDQGTFKGQCFLSCHGVAHEPKGY